MDMTSFVCRMMKYSSTLTNSFKSKYTAKDMGTLSFEDARSLLFKPCVSTWDRRQRTIPRH